MQVNRVGGGYCVDKTITYANINDSSGPKKSKRRSKEERKQMVQTFIQRYQASKKGSFPSLNLTHKEVGGSYYIVREIFRDIIQENRVLAPPKLEENMEHLDSFLENFPLGSISFDPNIHGLPPKDHKTLLNEYELRRANVLNTKRVSELHRRNFNNDIIINSSTSVIVNNEVFEEPEHTEFVTKQGFEGHEHEVNEVDVYQGHIRPLSENVVVETFPLRPISSMVFDEVVNTKSEDEIATSQTESKTFTCVEFENKALSTPSFEAATANKKKSGFQHSDTAKKINLESLEAAASKRSDSEESNPIVSFIKTCVATFMKLWSD